MSDDWTWDETLYAGSAPHYVAGRMAYPAALADGIAAELGLRGGERLVDVGCGPGSLTLSLAGHVGTAVGVDADPGMIEQAGVAAARSGVTNVTWRRMRAEDLPGDLGGADLVTFAQSFHWMQRARVAALVRGMLGADGACVHVGATTNRGDDSRDPLALPRPPHDAIEALVRAYLGPVRRAGRSLRPRALDGENEIFAAAGFTGPRSVDVACGEVVTRTVDDVVAATFSLSSSTPHLFGDALPRFATELRALLDAASDAGRFSERRRDITFTIWRP